MQWRMEQYDWVTRVVRCKHALKRCVSLVGVASLVGGTLAGKSTSMYVTFVYRRGEVG